ncbi:N(1)-aminopropylagmatine ureohydrolase [uncultured archaeon]|nr:N(1)-aminopropylagmatine ureohydrolase [uncultured archaeon]
MNFLKKPPVQIYEPQNDPNDLRVKNIIMTGFSGKPVKIGIIGVPFDKAISLGDGREGARFAPTEVRRALKKYGTTFNIEKKIDISDLTVVDFGDVEITDDIEETHERITYAVDNLLMKKILPIVIGGGHDISIGTVRALSKFHYGEIGGINIDAHFDVREIVDNKVTSGTTFRKLLDLELLREGNFVEIGAHDNLNSKIYYDYLISKGASIFTLSDITSTGTSAVMEEALKIAGSNTKSVFISIDIDSVAQCFAPGNSSPDARGFSPKQIRELAFIAGASKAVKLLDIVEINPLFDIDNRTARLGASIIISFLNGFKKRGCV